MNRADTIAQCNRHDQRHHDYQRGKNIQNSAKQQKQSIEQNQKYNFISDMRLNQVKQYHGDFGID